MNMTYDLIGTKTFWQITIYYNHKPETVFSFNSLDEALEKARSLRLAGIPLEFSMGD